MAIRGLKSLAGLLVAAIFALPAFGNTLNASTPNGGVSNPSTAAPGLINYIEGQVLIGTQVLNSNSVGRTQLKAGESLTTEEGKAEVLLTPGVFLRVGDNSSVKMISPDLANTVVELDKGHAIVEAADVHKQNDIRVIAGGATIRLLKPGLYDFDLRQDQLRVFDGKARVEDGGKRITVKGGRELELAQGSKLKPTKFKKEPYEQGSLYRWSSLRSAYLAEANVNLGDMYAADMWGGWGGPNWYWDPWFDSYTFIPGDGIFYSPFGWGFYSPWLAYNAPFYPFFGVGGVYGHGYGGPFPRRFNTFSRDWAGHSPYLADGNYSHGIYHGPGSMGGGFHSGRQTAGVGAGVGEFGGGGFHGGGFGAEGGGFHGGGGGGFHR